jgi:hypothetical protein
VSRAEFFPYPFAGEVLDLAFEPEDSDLEVGETGRILAEALPETAEVRLRLAVAVPDDVLDRVLPDAEREQPPVNVVVAARSIASRWRHAVPLSPDGDRWHGTLQVPKRELFGEVHLEPALIRTAAGDNGDYAGHLGALLATGREVVVEVDEPPVPAGGFLQIEWDNFRDSANHQRHTHPQHLYMLDTRGETPVLWLNEAIPDFKNVMHTRAPRGGNLRVRDAMFDTIVSQVWTSLASLAFARLAIEMARNEDSDEDPVGLLPEWNQRVINFWAPQLYDGTRDQAIEQVIEAASEPGEFADLCDRLATAVQNQARTGHAFRGLIRLRDREGV